MDPDAEIIRAMIRHENDLTNHRLTWFVLVEGLLAAALGQVFQKSFEVTEAIGVIGLLVSVPTLYSAWCANQAVKRLKKWWRSNKPGNYAGPDVIGHDSGIALLFPSFFMPIVMGCGWFVFLIWNFHQQLPLPAPVPAAHP